jgi:hypothetical protein
MTVTAEDRRDLSKAMTQQSLCTYRSLLAWPTTVDVDTNEVRLRVGDVIDVLTMRPKLAAVVNTTLIVRMMRAPVIVVDREPVEWIFLTQPRSTLRPSTWEELVRIEVGWKPVGSTIPLPTMHNPQPDRRWLEGLSPAGMPLPPWIAVVSAARSASELGGTW